MKKMIFTISIMIVTIIVGISATINIIIKKSNQGTKEGNEELNVLNSEVTENENIKEEIGTNNSKTKTEIMTTETPKTNNNQQSTNTSSTNNNQTTSTTPSTPNTDNNQQSTNTSSTNNNKTTTTTPNIDNNQSSTEDAIQKELEETTKKWFIAQYNIAKQQYITTLNSSISSKNSEITTLKGQASSCYVEYQKEVQRIKESCASSGLSGSGAEKQKLKNAEDNYKSQSSVYTNKVKQLESEVADLQAEVSRPSVENILSIVVRNTNISSKEASEYYNKYL